VRFDRVIALLVAFATVATAPAQGLVQTVTARKIGPGVEINVVGKDLALPRTVRTSGNRSYILEFEAGMTARARKENLFAGGVDYFQVVWFNARPPRIRVHLWLRNGQVNPVLEESATGWTVRVGFPAKTVPGTDSISANEPDLKNPLMAVDTTTPTSAKPPALPANPKANPLDQPFNPTPAPLYATPRPAPPVARPYVEPTVSLDFINTDVVQILKALALQAGVNIVASPDVKGTLTVSLSKMKLLEALDVVVALSNLRYAKVGRTFLVTTPDRFNETLRQLGSKPDEIVETRVVPIFSGQGTQIKATILKTLPQADLLGRYDLMLPSEQLTLEQKAPTASGLPGTSIDPRASQTTISTTSGDSGSATRDEYVVIVGSSARIPSLIKSIENIDQQICRALGINFAVKTESVQVTYKVKGANAVDLLKALEAKDGKVGTVRVAATPASSESRQSIVLSGRSTDVDQLVSVLEELDDVARVEQDFHVYDVKFVDPRSLRQELINHVPGLRAVIPPASAGNPNLFDPKSTRAAFTETTQAGPTGSGGEGSPGSSGSARQVSIGNTRGVQSGLEQPFKDLESIAVPMRLILRGTREQIKTALDYSVVVDVAPRQVAIEMRVMELSREDALKVGLDWSILTGGFVKTIRFNNTLGDSSATAGTVSGDFSNGGMSGSVLGTLDQLNDKRNVIARPNLLALDGRETELFVGDTIRYIESIQTTQNGVTVTTGEVRVGVRFAVICRVGGDGQITLDMRPVTSILNGFTPVPGGGNLPQTSERVAQSTAVVKSGETLALGGLIRDEERRTVGGIPILKDLPIIGQLFSRSEKRRDRTEIVFFITAREVTEADRQSAARPVPDPEPKAKKAPAKP